MTVSFNSREGMSVYRDLEKLNHTTFSQYVPDSAAIAVTKEMFIKEGFKIEAESEVGLSVSGSTPLINSFFNADVRRERLKFIRNTEYYGYETTDELTSPLCQKEIEKITLPKQLFVLEPKKEQERPSLGYYHFQVPAGVKKAGKVEALHQKGIQGRGIKAVMIDTGLYRHRYFKEQGYKFEVIPAVSSFDTSRDERGHGTGMASVLLAAAPAVDFKLVKAADRYFSYPVAAFQKAVGVHPDIINCSWGVIGYEPQLYLEIANAVYKEIIVVFSAGNGSSDRRNSLFQSVAYPDVISVGGCLPCEDGSVEISDISSNYLSDIFPGRYAPDLCGICGKLPYAQVILMPIEPGSLFDVENGKRDGTGQDDGWFVSSGTSAAAAYVTGLTALLLQSGPVIKRATIKNVLKECCAGIEKGKSFMGYPASAGVWNEAAGFGFLNGEGIRNYLEKVELPGKS